MRSNEVVEIDALYVYTCVVDGHEKVVVGTDGVPFMYDSKKVSEASYISEKMQEWADTEKVTIKLRMFKLLTTLDVIEPMQSKLMM